MSFVVGEPYQKLVDRLDNIHDTRYIIFDNETRLLFTSIFDDAWDPTLTILQPNLQTKSLIKFFGDKII
jgi:hypothetical protein